MTYLPTPEPAPARAGLGDDLCPACGLPHRPGKPCPTPAPTAAGGGGGDSEDRAAQLIGLLTAVREALDIPHAATAGHDKTAPRSSPGGSATP